MTALSQCHCNVLIWWLYCPDISALSWRDCIIPVSLQCADMMIALSWYQCIELTWLHCPSVTAMRWYDDCIVLISVHWADTIALSQCHCNVLIWWLYCPDMSTCILTAHCRSSTTGLHSLLQIQCQTLDLERPGTQVDRSASGLCRPPRSWAVFVLCLSDSD